MPLVIYALYDPETPNEIRYIGKTNKPLKEKLYDHINKAIIEPKSRSYKTLWIRALQIYGRKPYIKQLKVTSHNKWKEDHQAYILRYISEGHRLTNITVGGNSKTKIPGYAERRSSDLFIKAATSGKSYQDYLAYHTKRRQIKSYTEQTRKKRHIKVPNLPGIVKLDSKYNLKKFEIRYYFGESLNCRYVQYSIKGRLVSANKISKMTFPELPLILENLIKWTQKYEDLLLDFTKNGYLWDNNQVEAFLETIKDTDGYLKELKMVTWPADNIYVQRKPKKARTKKLDEAQQATRDYHQWQNSKWYKES